MESSPAATPSPSCAPSASTSKRNLGTVLNRNLLRAISVKKVPIKDRPQVLVPSSGSDVGEAESGALREFVAGVDADQERRELLDVDKPVECDVIISGAKQGRSRVMALCDDIPGARAIDGGPLYNARYVEQLTALLIGINSRYKLPEGAGLRLTYI